jgi:hypothetical protein
MTSNENNLNYKVVYLIESYKFRINFISIQVHTKKLRLFKYRLTLTVMAHTVAVLHYPTAVAHGGRSL